MLSDTSDATAPVTVSGSSGCMSPNVDEYVYVRVPTVSVVRNQESAPLPTPFVHNYAVSVQARTRPVSM